MHEVALDIRNGRTIVWAEKGLYFRSGSLAQASLPRLGSLEVRSLALRQGNARAASYLRSFHRVGEVPGAGGAGERGALKHPRASMPVVPVFDVRWTAWKTSRRRDLVSYFPEVRDEVHFSELLSSDPSETLNEWHHRASGTTLMGATVRAGQVATCELHSASSLLQIGRGDTLVNGTRAESRSSALCLDKTHLHIVALADTELIMVSVSDGGRPLVR